MGDLAASSTDPNKRYELFGKSIDAIGGFQASIDFQNKLKNDPYSINFYPGGKNNRSTEGQGADVADSDRLSAYLNSPGYDKFYNSEQSQYLKRIKDQYAVGGNLSDIISGQNDFERNHIIKLPSDTVEKNIIQPFTEAANKLKDALDKAGEDIKKFTNDGKTSFEIFLSTFRQQNDIRGALLGGRQINTGLLSSGFSALRGQGGFQLPSGIADYLLASTNSVANNTNGTFQSRADRIGFEVEKTIMVQYLIQNRELLLPIYLNCNHLVKI